MIPFGHRSFGTVCAVLVATLIAGCGGDLAEGELGRVVGPTPTLADLAGSWGGRIDPGARVDHCHGLVWTATQDGTIATGRFGIQGVCRTCPPFNPPMGTMTVTPSGSRFTVALTLPPGATSNPACSMTGSGTVSAGRSFESPETIMTGPVTLEFTPACGSGFLYQSSINTHSGTLLLVKGDSVSTGC
jgi:hypothetical protein